MCVKRRTIDFVENGVAPNDGVLSIQIMSKGFEGVVAACAYLRWGARNSCLQAGSLLYLRSVLFVCFDENDLQTGILVGTAILFQTLFFDFEFS